MNDIYNLERFVAAQENVFETAFDELCSGAKKSHWMWFIFPQLAGLGRSPTAQFYAISSLREARAYIAHPLLGPRLHQCVEALLEWLGRRSAEQILGPIDGLKLFSSLTLFDQVEGGSSFARALNGFFAGRRDELTLALLNCER